MKNRIAAIVVAALALFSFGVLGGCAAGGTLPSAQIEPLDSEGTVVDLASFKGSPMLVEFWATWCGPCREAMPEIQAIHDKFGPRGLKVVAISNETRFEVESFKKSSSYTYPVYLDIDESANRAFGVRGFPTAFLINREGRIVWAGHPRDPKLRPAIENVL